jgi:hypothetical protein
MTSSLHALYFLVLFCPFRFFIFQLFHVKGATVALKKVWFEAKQKGARHFPSFGLEPTKNEQRTLLGCAGFASNKFLRETKTSSIYMFWYGTENERRTLLSGVPFIFASKRNGSKKNSLRSETKVQ